MDNYKSFSQPAMPSKQGSEAVNKHAPPSGAQAHIESAFNNDHGDLMASHDTFHQGAKTSKMAAMKRRLGTNNFKL